MIPHEFGSTPGSIPCGKVIGKSTHAGRSKIETPSDTGIGDQAYVLTGFFHGFDGRLNGTPTLVLLVLPDEDHGGDVQAVGFKGIPVYLHRFLGIGILPVRVG